MSDPISSARVSIPCPSCGKVIKKSIGWISTHRNFSCDCGQDFEADDIRRKVVEAKNKIALAVKKEIEKLNRRFKR